MLESLGVRISELRAKLGWTQHQLAERIGISRVGLSHLEAGMSQPGERTVALLAGVFKMEPAALVAGTSYPMAKAERLPQVTARYTEIEHQLGLLERDLAWMERTGDDPAVAAEWRIRLAVLRADTLDPHERALIDEARARLR